MQEIGLWRRGQSHNSLDTAQLLDYRGETLARVAQTPALIISRTVADLRRAAPSPDEPLADRLQAIARAGQLLEGGAPGGWSLQEYSRLVALATGTPVTYCAEGLLELARGMSQIDQALRWQTPGGDLTVFDSRDVQLPDGRRSAWVPVGQVLGFIAPSNHPAVHLTWVMALAMGYTVLLRPGADDPFTPWRLIHALQEAGFPCERVAMLPGGHELVSALVEATDRTVAYGGATLSTMLGRDNKVLMNGPGHSKVLVDAPLPNLAEFLVTAIAHHGGRKCTCASAVVLRGDWPGLTAAVDERLAALPLLDPLDPSAVVPAWKSESALRQTPAEPAVVDGLLFARPALRLCVDPAQPPFGQEIPAPWATAAALPVGADPMAVLKGSLAVTLLSTDSALRRRALLEPSIQKLFAGPIPPWHSEPGAPHHGLLSDFLFTHKFSPEARLPQGGGPMN